MGVKIQTIKDLKSYIAGELFELYHEPEISALTNIIIKTLFGVSKLHEIYLTDQMVSRQQAERLIEICKELKTGKPIQYVTGETIFYDCVIRVNSTTLIPRQETEELVNLIITENRHYDGEIIDIGTGSGCIAIALAANLSDSKVTGIDISDASLSVARENALLNKVNISFINMDILNFAPGTINKAGIIVSNPPYVRNSEKKLMNRNVLDFEPHTALFVDDAEPLLFYKAILEASIELLLPRGRLYFEINEAMGQPMAKLLDSFGYTDIKIVKDINDKERIIKGIKNA